MEQKSIVLQNVWVPAEGASKFRESQNPETGERRFILAGLMLPFGKISRNNVLYEKASILDKHKQLIGRPVMYNHKVDGQELPVGHYTNSYCVEAADERHPVAGWYYEADIDPEEKDIIRKLRRGDLRHVSIQLVGGRVFERVDAQNGRVYTEAHVADIIEGSIVPAPGFLDTTAKFAEMLKGFSEQAGAVIPDTPMNNQGANPAGDMPSVQAENKQPRGTTTMAENQANTDVQASASSSADKDKGTPLNAQSVGQDKTAQPAKQLQENEAGKDTQASASIPPDSNKDFAKATPDSVGQDASYEDRNKNAGTMERASKGKRFRELEEDEEILEEDMDSEEPMTERFKEFVEAYEDDMSKMAEIMERLKEQLDTLKEEQDELKATMAGAPAMGAEQAAEPQPPLSENAKLRNVFVEAVSPSVDKKRFADAVSSVLRG